MTKVLNRETSELFRSYRESRRDVFLEETQRFIQGYGCTHQELNAVFRVCVARAKALRAPTGRKRGRPRAGEGLTAEPPSRPLESGQAQFIAGAPYELWERDWREHGWFREVCMVLSDFPANRPLLLEQINLFISEANQREIQDIRRTVKERRPTAKREKRGRPSVSKNDQIASDSIRVAWMRHIECMSWKQIAAALPSYWHDEKFKTLRNLEDYLAASIYRAIPPSYERVSAAGREIAPGALDSRQLQAHIGYRTGLPFNTHPLECKKIVAALWPRGRTADSLLFERAFAYRQKKRTV